MKKHAAIKYQNGIFIISGEIDFAAAMDLYEKSLPLLAKADDLSFDFSEVKSSNSAGLALILQWIKYAREKKKIIRVKELSADLLSIAKVAGVESLIVSNQFPK